MISLEKWMVLTPLQKLPNNAGNLGKIIVATSFEWLPRVQKNRPIWSHWLRRSSKKSAIFWRAKTPFFCCRLMQCLAHFNSLSLYLLYPQCIMGKMEWDRSAFGRVKWSEREKEREREWALVCVFDFERLSKEVIIWATVRKSLAVGKSKWVKEIAWETERQM